MVLMTGSASDLTRRASEELYALDPDQFVGRRTALAAAARQQGDAVAARQITALRKPSRSAWTVNALARVEGQLLGELADLADQLRTAEQNFDGERLRQLSRRRRTLIDTLARAAFAATGQGAPSATVREEVLAILSAALADEEVRDRLSTGTVVHAARWDGFGVLTRPDLALVPPPATKSPRRVHAPATERADKLGADRTDHRADAERERAVAAAEEQHRARVAAATAAVADAREQVTAAEQQERDQADQLGRLKDQLADAQRGVDSARGDLRTARRQLSQAERHRDALHR
jgi:hypothetical protein